MSDTYLTSWGIGLSTILILGTIIYFRSGSKPNTSKKQKKKSEKPVKKLTLLEQFQQSLIAIERNVKTNIEPEIDDYYVKFDELPLEDRLYKYNYFSEALLKELIKLDGIDLTLVTDETIKKALKDERKVVIKHIQGLQKGLDAYKKENSDKFPKN